MPEERCELTELIKSQCAHCRGVGYSRDYGTSGGPETWPIEPFDELDETRTTARFPGTCPVCLEKVTVGEVIQRHTTESWRHADCSPTGE